MNTQQALTAARANVEAAKAQMLAAMKAAMEIKDLETPEWDAAFAANDAHLEAVEAVRRLERQAAEIATWSGFVCTDRDAVDAAVAAKTPRSVEAILRDRYPNCNIDRQGRAHAPHDCYVDEETGGVYRGGEYLPAFPYKDADALSCASFFNRGGVKPIRALFAGEILEWNGTKAQRQAAVDVLKAQGNAVLAQTSRHLGTVGDKITAAVTIKGLRKVPGFYGDQWFHFMLTADGAVVVYRGTKKLAEKGEAVTVVAKVKNHADREGVAQTWVERPKVMAPCQA